MWGLGLGWVLESMVSDTYSSTTPRRTPDDGDDGDDLISTRQRGVFALQEPHSGRHSIWGFSENRGP